MRICISLLLSLSPSTREKFCFHGDLTNNCVTFSDEFINFLFIKLLMCASIRHQIFEHFTTFSPKRYFLSNGKAISMHVMYDNLFQGMVFPTLTRSAQSDVLLVYVRRQQQLQSTDQPRVIHQSWSSKIFWIHRPIHRHGPLSQSLKYIEF